MAPFVAFQDLLACARVSRQWHRFFTPYIWYSIVVPEEWSNDAAFPPLSVLEKNAHFIRSLTLKASKGLSSFFRHCTGLKTLVVFGEHVAKPHPDLWDELTDLIRHNASIEWIIFGFSLSNAPSTAFLKALPEACPNLRRYESSQGRYDDPEQVEALMQAITRLSQVSSRYEYFVNVPTVKRWTFPHLCELTLKDARGLGTQTQVDLVCQCPNIRLLKWTVCRETFFPVQEFCARIPAACPRLCQLQMDGCGLPDPDDIGRILDSLARLEQLMLCGSSITRRTFRSLGRHFQTLQLLDVVDCFYVKSWMVQQILENCENLTKLTSSVLLMRDIVAGKDWAAVGLKYLQVNMVPTKSFAVSIEEQWMTFEQLSRLTQLQHLATGPRSWTPREGLLYRMECGVDQLRTLTKLKVLIMGKSWQRMSKEDLAWMTGHLENLTKVEGIFHPDWDQHLKLSDGFRECGIEVQVIERPDLLYSGDLMDDGEDDFAEYEAEEEDEEDEDYEEEEGEEGDDQDEDHYADPQQQQQYQQHYSQVDELAEDNDVPGDIVTGAGVHAGTMGTEANADPGPRAVDAEHTPRVLQ
ncbi:hypothetical protein BGZ54_001426 [Gamsiella multidivaricata]|nr:hypothetical protein BGZ54_001426 [Gamsiella multidivaricata]